MWKFEMMRFIPCFLVMLRHFFAVFSQKRTPLHSASRKGHADVVKVLLDAGADVEIRDTWVRSLHLTRFHLFVSTLLSEIHATSLGFGLWLCGCCEAATGCWRCRKRS